MGNGLSKKLKQDKDFVNHVSQLTSLFEKADQAKLKAAVETGDFNGLCKAVGLSEQSIRLILENGTEHVKKLMKDKEVVEAMQKRGMQTAG
jgi:hypothetical protein